MANEVTYYNELTEENETKTYIFDEKKANRPIEFIENFVDTLKVNGLINL